MSATTTSHTFRVGDCARSIETGWLGIIVELRDDPIIVDHDTPPIPCTMAKMINIFRWERDGVRHEETYPDEVQYFSTADLRHVP
jgi:hypothetical protein